LAAIKELKEYIGDRQIEHHNRLEQERRDILEAFKDYPTTSSNTSKAK